MRPNADPLGYYPTDPLFAPLIATRIHPNPEGSDRLRLLDPCAGDGSFLISLAQLIDADPYGIEINAERSIKLVENLRQHYLASDRVNYAGFRHDALTASLRRCADIVYLNPPYVDWEKQSPDDNNRAERAFLAAAGDWLPPGGLLIYVISRHNYKIEDTKHLLANYNTVRAFALPDNPWNQCALFATRASHKTIVTTEQAEELLHRIWGKPDAETTDDLPYIDPLPTVNAQDSSLPVYIVSAQVARIRSARFAPTDPSLEHMLQQAQSVGLRAHPNTFHRLTKPRSGDLGLLTPPRIGHIPAILSEQMPTVTVKDGIIRAIVAPKVEVEQEVEEQDDATVYRTITQESKTVTAWMITNDGELIQTTTHAMIEAITASLPEVVGQITDKLPPRYNMDHAGFGPILATLSPNRPIAGTDGYSGMLPAQAHAAAAIATELRYRNAALLGGEMGTGKTLVSTAIARLIRAKRTVVMSPPHLLGKWQDEIEAALPGTYTATARTPAEADAFFARPNPDPAFLVIPSTGSLTSGWSHAYSGPGGPRTTNYRTSPRDDVKPIRPLPKRFPKLELDAATIKENIKYTRFIASRYVRCPDCGHNLYTDKQSVLPSDFTRTKRNCPNCQAPLWQETRRTSNGDNAFNGYVEWDRYATKLIASIKGHRNRRGLRRPGNPGYAKVSLMAHIASRYKGEFTLIADEAHEYASMTSSRGQGFRQLVAASHRAIAMTGTWSNGKSSSLFGILYSISAAFRKRYGFNETNAFVKEHGSMITVETERRKHSRGGTDQSRTPPREMPGISPVVVAYMLPQAVFLTLEDVGINIPKPRHIPVVLTMTETMSAIYQKLVATLKPELAHYLARNSKALLSAYIFALEGWPNAIHRGRTILRPDGTEIIKIPPLPDEEQPKLIALTQNLKTDIAEGRRSLVFFQQTDTLNIMDFVAAHLERNEIKTAICDVDPEQRREWFDEQQEAGVQAILLHPRRAALGLDLIAWPSLHFYEAEKWATVFMQVLARPRRIGQTQPITARHYAYSGTLEIDRIYLNAAKLIANAVVDGTVPDETMSRLAKQASDNPVAALAKAVVSGESLTNAADFAAIMAAASAAFGEEGSIISGKEKLKIPTTIDTRYLKPVGKRRSSVTGEIHDLYRNPYGEIILQLNSDKARPILPGEELQPPDHVVDTVPATEPAVQEEPPTEPVPEPTETPTTSDQDGAPITPEPVPADPAPKLIDVEEPPAKHVSTRIYGKSEGETPPTDHTVEWNSIRFVPANIDQNWRLKLFSSITEEVAASLDATFADALALLATTIDVPADATMDEKRAMLNHVDYSFALEATAITLEDQLDDEHGPIFKETAKLVLLIHLRKQLVKATPYIILGRAPTLQSINHDGQTALAATFQFDLPKVLREARPVANAQHPDASDTP